MLSYSEYSKRDVAVTMKLKDWDFISHILRLQARKLNEELKPNDAKPYMDCADKIDKVIDKIIYGG